MYHILKYQNIATLVPSIQAPTSIIPPCQNTEDTLVCFASPVVKVPAY